MDQVYATHHESTLGNLFSDAYKWAVEQATGESVDLALTASGVIRESIPQGAVTVSDVFNAASLGIGADGVPGYPLVSVYLTGADLKTVMEIDASVSDLMTAARLYSSGVEYSYNTNRMIFNKVTDSALRRADGNTQAIVDDQLYRVVTGAVLWADAGGGGGYLLRPAVRDRPGQGRQSHRHEPFGGLYRP